MAEDGVFEGLQPHEGTSETGPALTGAVSMDELQPHEGTSETRRPREDPSSSANFNPTRVRLKLGERLDAAFDRT